LICLPGTPSVNYEDSDMPLYFRQSRYFYYLVTYNIKQDALYVWIPPPNTGRSRIYNGNNPSKEEIKAIADFDLVALNTQFQDYITFFTSRKEGPIYVLHEYQAPISRNIPNSRDDPSIHVKPRVDFTLLKPAMNASRVIKSPYEIAQIRKANAITALAHTAVLRSLLTLTNEAEIEAIFTATCIASQAKSQAYGIIAGSGRNASTLHYIANNEPLKGRQLVCLDAGCEWGNYASDVTRTFPINGKWTKEGRAIYRVVERMQEECIRMVKPGEDYRRIQLHAHRVLVEELLKLGILCGGGLEEVLKSGVSTAFLPHGLGREFPISSVEWSCSMIMWIANTYRLHGSGSP
jgi:Xaa-Pro dipeptidase